jgi:cation diffusion facilitator CzcD-associated flavoprotein CzcO
MIDVAIIGAGPYGLSIAAYLRKTQLSFRIFGKPMQSWREQMPKGMLLKSDGFASSLYDPDSAFTLQRYCADRKLPYADVGIPVPAEVFVNYGLEFQKRFVPNLEETDIKSVKRIPGGFELETVSGETLQARRTVVAAGITHFGYLPPFLAELPKSYASHSSAHYELSGFQGKDVAVVGAGASAVDIAALLHEAGARVHLVARRQELLFHSPPSDKPPSIIERIKNPRSGLGLGWRSRIYSDIPLAFYRLPQKVRFRVVRRHLGPAPGWFVRDKVVGRFPQYLGSSIKGAAVENEKVKLSFIKNDGEEMDLFVDHVIGATGFKVEVSRLKFLSEEVRQKIETVDDTPVLTTNFETTVPGLYLVGVASANCFGPLTRFAYGAKFTAKHLARHLARKGAKPVAA